MQNLSVLDFGSGIPNLERRLLAREDLLKLIGVVGSEVDHSKPSSHPPPRPVVDKYNSSLTTKKYQKTRVRFVFQALGIVRYYFRLCFFGQWVLVDRWFVFLTTEFLSRSRRTLLKVLNRLELFSLPY